MLFPFSFCVVKSGNGNQFRSATSMQQNRFLLKQFAQKVYCYMYLLCIVESLNYFQPLFWGEPFCLEIKMYLFCVILSIILCAVWTKIENYLI